MTTLYYYKGTPFVYDCMLSQDNAMQLGKEQIALGLRLSGISLEQQATDYFQQLDIVETCLFKHSKDGMMTNKCKVKVSKELGMSIDKLYGMWCVNICSLLIMKKLKDDDMNGIMSIQMSKRR
jgi:hypothetical protein